MKRILLLLVLALWGANAHAQMGWQLPRVQQYFDQPGERQHFNPTRAKGIFQGRIFYSFHTPAYDVRVGFDTDGTVGFIGWMKTHEDDGDNPTAKFTEPEVDRLLTFASKVEWRRGPDTFGNSNGGREGDRSGRNRCFGSIRGTSSGLNPAIERRTKITRRLMGEPAALDATDRFPFWD